MDDCFLGVSYRNSGLEETPMTGCCLYCKFAGSGWISSKDGTNHVDKYLDFYKAMNIYCNNPITGMDGQCFQISFVRCSLFERDTDERIQRRIDFYSKFPRFKAHAEMIAQRH